MAKKKERIKKPYTVKVPVYATEVKEGSFTYEEVIVRLKKELDNYNENTSIGRVAFNKNNKTQRKVIQKVDYFEYAYGEDPNAVPLLLLKTTSFNTNIHDAYTEDPDGTIRVLSDVTKLVSEHNYMLFYPNFVGYEPKQKANWLIFICGDTNKNDTDIVNTAKLVISGVLRLSFVCIKPKDILNKIQKASIPIFQIRYIGVEKDISDANEKYSSYLVDSKIKKDKKKTYKDIPLSSVDELLKEEFDHEEYQVREAEFIQGKNKFKLIKKFRGITEDEYDEFDVLKKEAQMLFEETAELSFTDTFELLETEEKEKKLHDKDFILEKSSPIIINYIASYNV